MGLKLHLVIQKNFGYTIQGSRTQRSYNPASPLRRSIDKSLVTIRRLTDQRDGETGTLEYYGYHIEYFVAEHGLEEVIHLLF